MSTINDRAIVYKLIEQDGYFESDPRAYMVVEYTNAWGDKTYGVTWEDETLERRLRYLKESDKVINPQLIWKAENKKGN